MLLKAFPRLISVLAVFSLILMGSMSLAFADAAEVREIARNNGCPPKKIDVYQQSLGTEGQTIFRVQCAMPKVVDEASKGPDALLIACRDTLCEMLRPVQDEKK